MIFGAVITLLVTSTFCQGVCPDFWVPFHGSCYHLFSELEQWTQAQFMCTLHDANLAGIESAAENNFLKNEVIKTHVDDPVWLGATDMLNEGDFRWTGSNLPMTFTDWGPGEPTTGEDYHQNCLQFWHPNDVWVWDDTICTVKKRFICEMSNSAVVG